MNDSTKLVHSVEKALIILEALSRTEEIGISELSRELGMGKATIYRILTTLRTRGYVDQTPSGKYTLNFKIFELSNRMVNRIEIRKIARPHLEKLAAITNETVNLAILEHTTMVYIDRIESREPLRMGLDIGARLPAFCTALGLAMIAYLNPVEIDSLLVQAEQEGQLKKYTINTIIDRSFIKRQLAVIKEQGYSFDNEYYLPGIRGIAAPIFNHSNILTAAISIAGPTIRLTEEVVLQFVPVLKETANTISLRMGYSG